MALQSTPVFRALHRSETFLGMERVPGLLCVGLCCWALLPSFAGQRWWMLAVLVAVLLGGVNGLRAVAKGDPQWFAAYRQRWRLRGFYLALSTPYRVDRRCPNS